MDLENKQNLIDKTSEFKKSDSYSETQDLAINTLSKSDSNHRKTITISLNRYVKSYAYPGN
jgi:hypothetical protein